MKTILKKRHYCDYCRKSGARVDVMRKHESRCTLNPNRQCGVCELMGEEPVKPKELAHLVYSSNIGLTEEQWKELRKKCHNCPACILACIRFANAVLDRKDCMFVHSVGFDFKKELQAFMDEYNAENMASMGMDY